MDDLKSIVECHEQARRLIEDQLGRVVDNLDKLERKMDRNEQFLARAFRLGVVAFRRERFRRQEEDNRLAERQAADRAAWEEKHAAWEEKHATDRAAWEERMERTERNIDRFLEGFQGRNGGNGSGRAS